MKEHSRSVLGADVGALPIPRCRIVEGKEYSKKILERSLPWVVLDLKCLSVPGGSRTNLSIRRLFDLPSGIPNHHLQDSSQLVK
jgi:hypothetical protein